MNSNILSYAAQHNFRRLSLVTSMNIEQQYPKLCGTAYFQAFTTSAIYEQQYPKLCGTA